MVKTAELTDALLDWWVARAVGHTLSVDGKTWDAAVKQTEHGGLRFFSYPVDDWRPSTNPAHGWPIIDRDGIGTSKDPFEPVWHAELEHPARPDGCQRSFAQGPTSLIAAMRAKVASVYGDEVPGP